MAEDKRPRKDKENIHDHDEKYRDESTEESEPAYFGEDECEPPSVCAGGPKDHTQVDEAAYMGEEPDQEHSPSKRKLRAVGDRSAEEGEASQKEADRPPSPGVPNFWASAELGDDEDWVPPTRNRPSSSPWSEKGKLEEAE